MHELTPYEAAIMSLSNALKDAQLQESYVPVEEIARQIVTWHPDAWKIAAWIKELNHRSDA